MKNFSHVFALVWFALSGVWAENGAIRMEDERAVHEYSSMSGGPQASGSGNTGNAITDGNQTAAPGLNGYHQLATTGATFWVLGVLLELTGAMQIENSHRDLGMVFLTTGVVLDLVGPLFSIGAEAGAKRAVNQYDGQGLGGGHTGGKYYLWNLLFLGGTIGINASVLQSENPPRAAGWAATGMSAIALVLRGMAAFAPVYRISYAKKQVTFHPYQDSRGQPGLAMRVAF